tara:strand:- start:63 stop:200 length:138 start_codon:yes stop_codon:yes gene_type:complete
MTVGALTQQLTQEELVSWSAYYSLKNEQEEKARDQAKMVQRAKMR